MEKPIIIPNRAQGIYGILHAPRDFATQERRVGLILIHSQGGSKIGHKRSFVELSRRLEAKGVAVLRFDLLGEGESEELNEDPYLNWRGIIPAIKYLCGALPIDRLILLGDCFGGLLSAYYSKLDRRVERVIAWNLAQMKWPEDLLAGFEGSAAMPADSLTLYRHKLFTRDVWRKLLTFNLHYSEIIRHAFLAPAGAHFKRIARRTTTMTRRLFAGRQSDDGKPSTEAGRQAPVCVLHASSPPGSERAVAIARHVFDKLGFAAEHVLIPGIPFSQSWKSQAFAQVEGQIFRDDQRHSE
jgi:pimeloyl-ACP methyl ester carboxylesterase